MKRILTIVLAFILTATIGVGVFFGFKYKTNIKDYFSKLTSSSEEFTSSSESGSSDSSSSSSSSDEEAIDYKQLYETEKLNNENLTNINSNLTSQNQALEERLEEQKNKFEGISVVYTDTVHSIFIYNELEKEVCMFNNTIQSMNSDIYNKYSDIVANYNSDYSALLQIEDRYYVEKNDDFSYFTILVNSATYTDIVLEINNIDNIDFDTFEGYADYYTTYTLTENSIKITINIEVGGV